MTPAWSIVGFYTPGRYEREADRLRASLDRLGLSCDLRRIEDRGTWAANSSYTATFLCDMLVEYLPRPLVYVDVDAVFHSYPTLFDDLSGNVFDLAAHRCDWGQLANGTLWLSNSAACRKVINDYRVRVANSPGEKDEQRHLDVALRAYPLARVYQLPASYCYIHRLMRLRAGESPVVEHLQASRESGSTLLEQRRERIEELERQWNPEPIAK